MAEKALIFIESVFLAEEATLLLELRLTIPAAVFVPGMLFAPEASGDTLFRVANEACLTRCIVLVGKGGDARTGRIVGFCILR